MNKTMSQRSHAYQLTRDVTQEECPWLGRDFKKGETVFEYLQYTYGCISPSGKAFTEVFDETPFFELPIDSVDQEDQCG